MWPFFLKIVHNATPSVTRLPLLIQVNIDIHVLAIHVHME